MNYKSPGQLPKNDKGLLYLAPGDASDAVDQSGTDSIATINNVFPAGIIVKGGIETDNINVSDTATTETAIVNSSFEIQGDLKLSENAELKHGAWRTRAEGDRLIREYWNGSTWQEGDTVTP